MLLNYSLARIGLYPHASPVLANPPGPVRVKKTHDHNQFQMSNLTIITLHAKHANLLLAILKLQKW